MSVSTANLWDTEAAKDIAREIATIQRVYCGPAVVGWIAAVWNHHVGRPYDYMKRLQDKKLFPDGPRDFTGAINLPKFQTSLKSILMRETENELSFSEDTHYRYGTIHDQLEEHDMPIVIRMHGPEFSDGLHYVTLYKSEKQVRPWKLDLVKFYWQDNGVYGSRNGGNGGLYATEWREVGENVFTFGAKPIAKTLLGFFRETRKAGAVAP